MFVSPVLATDRESIRAMLPTPGGALSGYMLEFDGTLISVPEPTAMRRLLIISEGRRDGATRLRRLKELCHAKVCGCL